MPEVHIVSEALIFFMVLRIQRRRVLCGSDLNVVFHIFSLLAGAANTPPVAPPVAPPGSYPGKFSQLPNYYFLHSQLLCS